MTTTATTRPLTLRDGPNSSGPFNLRDDGPSLLAALLEEQQQLSAVELFSQRHDRGDLPAQVKHYSKLLPASSPGPGQQYAFEVDLDRCSGCKACVTACHSLNGLDERETWRDVGLLVGGTPSSPVMQHVTTACHHCLEPACMIACPVDAYEKDPRTGIVKHLDDQCFGCQYCTLACPYDVPKYHSGKGIVRKCDMCSSRLAQGEAPACVQACPHQAIAIRVVDVNRVIEDSEADHFLPAAPEPHLTLPTTTYKTKRVFPRNMLPADYYSVSPQHPHWPLIVMLVLTQLSVGAFTTGCLLETIVPSDLAPLFRPLHATNSLVFGLLALAASVFHLGRPLYAFRGIIGLRHSWLSREILAFGIFAGLAVLYAGACWLASPQKGWNAVMDSWLPLCGWLVVGAGTAGVFCSVMIYVFTRRELWRLERTTIRFGLTSALLGVSTTWLSLMLMGWVDPLAGVRLITAVTPPLARFVILFSILKLGFDALLLRHLASTRNTPLKRSALLVTGVLSPIAVMRLISGVIGGVVLPLIVLQQSTGDSAFHFNRGTIFVIVLMWTGCLLGELLERYLFFSAVSAPRMPGGVRP